MGSGSDHPDAGIQPIVRIEQQRRSKTNPHYQLTCYVGNCRQCGKEVSMPKAQWKRWQGWCFEHHPRRPHNSESGRSGVYAIRNTTNGRAYYGSTCDWYRRRYTHRRDLRLGKHHCQYLQRAWNKYGEEAFEFVLLADVPRELLFDEEAKLLRSSPDKYNTGTAAGAAFLGRRHTEEARRKMSEIQKRRAALHPVSDETKEKIRQANLGKKYSLETRKKVSAAFRGRGKGYCWHSTRKRWYVQVRTDNGKRTKLCKTEDEAIRTVTEFRSLDRKEVVCGSR